MTSEAHAARHTPVILSALTMPHEQTDVCRDGFSEPTATIVWGALLKIGVLRTSSSMECLSVAFIRSLPRAVKQSYA